MLVSLYGPHWWSLLPKIQILGKTVLFSSIIDQIKQTVPDSHVVFFYCKNRDPLKNTFEGVARSLIAQLLRVNPVSIDYLYDTAVRSREQHPSTFESYSKILEHITAEHDSLFVGIDGLDECEKKDRQSILLLLENMIRLASPQSQIKFFFTSQILSDLKDSLRSSLRFDIKNHHIRQDIQSYVHRRSLLLCKEFKLTSQRGIAIASEISSRCEGKYNDSGVLKGY